VSEGHGGDGGGPGGWKVGRFTRSGASPFFTESLNPYRTFAQGNGAARRTVPWSNSRPAPRARADRAASPLRSPPP
jgi:hypothetical protein